MPCILAIQSSIAEPHAAKIRFGAALWSKSTDEVDTFRKAIGVLGDAQYFADPSSVFDGLKAWTDHE